MSKVETALAYAVDQCVFALLFFFLLVFFVVQLLVERRAKFDERHLNEQMRIDDWRATHKKAKARSGDVTPNPGAVPASKSPSNKPSAAASAHPNNGNGNNNNNNNNNNSIHVNVAGDDEPSVSERSVQTVASSNPGYGTANSYKELSASNLLTQNSRVENALPTLSSKPVAPIAPLSIDSGAASPHRNPRRIGAESNSLTVGRLQWSFHRLGLLVSLLLCVRAIDPHTVRGVFSYSQSAFLSWNVNALLYVSGVILFFYPIQLVLFVAFRRRSKSMVVVGAVLSLISISLSNVIPAIYSVLGALGYLRAVLYVWYSVSILVIAIVFNVYMHRLSRSVHRLTSVYDQVGKIITQHNPLAAPPSPPAPLSLPSSAPAPSEAAQTPASRLQYTHTTPSNSSLLSSTTSQASSMINLLAPIRSESPVPPCEQDAHLPTFAIVLHPDAAGHSNESDEETSVDGRASPPPTASPAAPSPGSPSQIAGGLSVRCESPTTAEPLTTSPLPSPCVSSAQPANPLTASPPSEAPSPSLAASPDSPPMSPRARVVAIPRSESSSSERKMLGAKPAEGSSRFLMLPDAVDSANRRGSALLNIGAGTRSGTATPRTQGGSAVTVGAALQLHQSVSQAVYEEYDTNTAENSRIESALYSRNSVSNLASSLASGNRNPPRIGNTFAKQYKDMIARMRTMQMLGNLLVLVVVISCGILAHSSFMTLNQELVPPSSDSYRTAVPSMLFLLLQLIITAFMAWYSYMPVSTLLEPKQKIQRPKVAKPKKKRALSPCPFAV